MSAILPVIRLVSAGHHAAVHQQNGSSDPRTLVGCKKENCFCYISRLTNPSQWMERIEGRQNLRNLFLGKKCGVDRSLDYGRSDSLIPFHARLIPSRRGRRLRALWWRIPGGGPIAVPDDAVAIFYDPSMKLILETVEMILQVIMFIGPEKQEVVGSIALTKSREFAASFIWRRADADSTRSIHGKPTVP
jgi:hypothetical protein